MPIFLLFLFLLSSLLSLLPFPFNSLYSLLLLYHLVLIGYWLYVYYCFLLLLVL